MKGLVHAGLAALAAFELLDAQSPKRKFLLGAACGWHLHATFYHFCLEVDQVQAALNAD